MERQWSKCLRKTKGIAFVTTLSRNIAGKTIDVEFFLPVFNCQFCLAVCIHYHAGVLQHAVQTVRVSFTQLGIFRRQHISLINVKFKCYFLETVWN